MHDLPDHPDIHQAELTGYPYKIMAKTPLCPVCGEETDTLYKSSGGEIFGCIECVSTVDAWDEEDYI